MLRQPAVRGTSRRFQVVLAGTGRGHGGHHDRAAQLQGADGADGLLVVEGGLDILGIDLEPGRERDPAAGPAQDDQVPVVIDPGSVTRSPRTTSIPLTAWP